jgi:hypothetical protein
VWLECYGRPGGRAGMSAYWGHGAVHGTGLARVHVHGNAGRSLGSLGGMVASEWHVHCAA